MASSQDKESVPSNFNLTLNGCGLWPLAPVFEDSENGGAQPRRFIRHPLSGFLFILIRHPFQTYPKTSGSGFQGARWAVAHLGKKEGGQNYVFAHQLSREAPLAPDTGTNELCSVCHFPLLAIEQLYIQVSEHWVALPSQKAGGPLGDVGTPWPTHEAPWLMQEAL